MTPTADVSFLLHRVVGIVRAEMIPYRVPAVPASSCFFVDPRCMVRSVPRLYAHATDVRMAAPDACFKLRWLSVSDQCEHTQAAARAADTGSPGFPASVHSHELNGWLPDDFTTRETMQHVA